METRCGDSWACLKSCAESGYMTHATMVPNYGWCRIYWCKDWSFLLTFTDLACLPLATLFPIVKCFSSMMEMMMKG